jgi:predicted HicB family RNase H-like nuclease
MTTTSSTRARAQVTTAIRFPPQTHADLATAAREHGRSINWLVNQAVTDFLPRLLPAEEVVLTRPPSIRLGG